MPRYEVTVVVEYVYEVEAEDYEGAEKRGWEYEDYQHTGSVDSIEVAELPEEEEESNAI